MLFVSTWLTNLLRRKSKESGLPLGLTEAQVQGLQRLVASPDWKHWMASVEALAASQLSELSSGLPHDRYLFTCGALYALRRCYQFPEDVLTTVTNLKEIGNARARASAERESRARNTFLNTPWWEQYVRDAAKAGAVPLR